MNVAEYGGGLQRIGLDNLQALADLEQRRLTLGRMINEENSQAKAEAIGGLVGTAVGAGKGYFSDREAQHNQREATAQADRDMERQAIMTRNIQQGLPARQDLPERYSPTRYSALDDIHDMFKDLGWAD